MLAWLTFDSLACFTDYDIEFDELREEVEDAVMSMSK